MANKRDLKRTIHYVCGDLLAECVAASLYGEKPEKENIDALLTSILALQNQYIKRVSHPEPGMKQKDYFKDLICLLYTSPSPRDISGSRMPSSA